MCGCLCTMCVPGVLGGHKRALNPGTVVTDGCEPLCGCFIEPGSSAGVKNASLLSLWMDFKNRCLRLFSLCICAHMFTHTCNACM